MATPNKLEVVLSFKPLMDGLNRFVSGYQARMAQVQAFNQRIQNGEAALQRALGQVGAVIGGAALVKYARDAREADKVQAQLIQTLRKTGQTGALEALNAQAAALQRVTEFSDESVNTVQRLLISFGLTAQQAEGLTESVLDFAQATGQSAESAAMLIGRTLAGDSEELGRYQIKLDTTKGKVDALRDALGRYAGQARAGVPDAARREIDARYADATEDLGRAANTAAVPFFQALLPLLERFSAWATANAQNIASVARSLGDMAAKAAPVVLAFGGLSAGMTAVALVLNPLRALVVVFSGRSLLELSNQLAKSTGGFSALWTTLRGGGGVITGIGSALSALGGVAAAAFAGWKLGELINEFEVSGLKIKDWAAIAIVYIQDKVGAVWTDLRSAWAVTKAAGVAFWDSLKIVTLSAVIAILEAWNKLPFGKKLEVDLSPLRKELDATIDHLAGAEGRLKDELATITRERAAQLVETAELVAFIEKSGRAPAQPGAAPGAAGGGGGPDLNDQRFGQTDAKAKAEADLKAKRDLYALETQILEAKLRGDETEARRLTRQRDRMQGINELGQEAVALVDARLNANDALTRQQRQRDEEERQLSQQLGDLAIRRADIESNRYTTAEEKRRALLPLLQEEGRLLVERVALLERERLAGVTDERRGQIQQQLDALRQQQADNRRSQADAQPQSVFQAIAQWAADAETRLGTVAERVRAAFTSVGDTIRTSLGSALADMILRAASFKDAMIGFGQAIVTAFVNTGAQMIADWIFAHTVMAAIKSVFKTKDVAEHTAGEVVKTQVTAAGEAARTGIITAAAAANTTVVTAEAGAIAGATGIAGVFRSIMELGPIAGPAVFAASIAGMIALVNGLVKGFATGGLVTGPGSGTSDSIPARLSNGEFVATAAAVSRFGAGFFSDLNAGVLNLAALPGSIASQLPAAAASLGGGSLAAASAGPASASPRISIFVHTDDGIGRAWLEKQSGQRVLYRLLNQNRAEQGLES